MRLIIKRSSFCAVFQYMINYISTQFIIDSIVQERECIRECIRSVRFSSQFYFKSIIAIAFHYFSFALDIWGVCRRWCRYCSSFPSILLEYLTYSRLWHVAKGGLFCPHCLHISYYQLIIMSDILLPVLYLIY